jgi:hypothetical protein
MHCKGIEPLPIAHIRTDLGSFGRQLSYHWTNNAYCVITEIIQFFNRSQ